MAGLLQESSATYGLMLRVIPRRTRYIAVDLGDKRTGIAMADGETFLVSPVGVLEVPITHNAGKDLSEAICNQVLESVSSREQLELIIGLPLIQDKVEGPRAKIVRTFMNKVIALLKEHYPTLNVHYQDETLSSAQADWSMARSGLTYGAKKAKRDSLAAAVILQDFLSNQTRGTQELLGDGHDVPTAEH